MSDPLLTFTENGIYCSQAKVYIDPWKPVNKAIITHAHADHSRVGMKHYLAHHHSIPVMKHRLGDDISVEGKNYGEEFSINGVTFSLHPAGHIIGSAQVRVAYKGEIWVASGDYKLENDLTCTPFEPVKCHAFITESTFGLPVFKWKPQSEVMGEINDWWARCNAENKTPIIFSYSLGKAQRIINHVNHELGPILTHGAVELTNEVLRHAGLEVKPTVRVTPETDLKGYKNALVIAPPGAMNSKWMSKFKPVSTGMASGWMNLRGARRRQNYDRGFVLSDHADWDGLNTAVKATGAEKIFVTHGYTDIYSKWLTDQGYDAQIVNTEFTGESLDEPSESENSPSS
ncbi:MAG: ligase-associated DNA damage response exonuclease [Flavobacteriales bacterium]